MLTIFTGLLLRSLLLHPFFNCRARNFLVQWDGRPWLLKGKLWEPVVASNGTCWYLELMARLMKHVLIMVVAIGKIRISAAAIWLIPTRKHNHNFAITVTTETTLQIRCGYHIYIYILSVLPLVYKYEVSASYMQCCLFVTVDKKVRILIAATWLKLP